MEREVSWARRRPTVRLSVFAAAVLLGGLLVAASAETASAAAGCVTVGTQVTCPFLYNGTNGSDGTPQHFVVPPGVTSVTIEASGATGARNASGSGGFGGLVKGTVRVTPTETLTVRVGGEPLERTGGYNGGGNGAPGSNETGGGGASDVRQGGDTLTDRIVVAGGGGAGSAGFPMNVGSGGDGGGPNGGAGIFCENPDCGGGSPTQGGKGGDSIAFTCTGATNGSDGRLAGGGDGGSGCGFFAGGGGGGLYGGGGGAVLQTVIDLFGQSVVVTEASGGGGGSGFVTPTATNQTNEAGRAEPGNGEVTITYSPGNIVATSFKNCNTLHVVYNRFITGTVVHWRVTTNGIGTVASGQFSAIGGGTLGSKTYHFMGIALGTTLPSEASGIRSHVLYTWANGDRFYATRDTGC
jgi:Glycine rich protein